MTETSGPTSGRDAPRGSRDCAPSGETTVGRALSRLSPALPASALLDALNGVTYLVDGDGVLLAYSPDPLGRLAPRPDDEAAARYVGRSLFEAIGSPEVREASRSLHHAVWSGRRAAIGFEYRCDDPDMKRSMWLSLTRIDHGAAPMAVLYQSLVLSETPRASVWLFSPSARREARAAADDEPLVTVCSYCHCVAWPPGPERAQWIEAAEYYRRGGSDEVRVSHGVCGACFERVVRPSLPAHAART